MAEKTVPDYLQNEMTLKKINSILKEKNRELEIKINHLAAENSELKEKTKNPDTNGKMLSQKNIPLIFLGSVFTLGLLVPINAIVFDSVPDFDKIVESENDKELKSSYVVENLRGDIVQTHVNWKWAKDSPINVSVLNTHLISGEQMDSLKDAIVSMDEITLDDFSLHKGPKGSTSVYNSGWQGAVTQIGDNTLYTPPSTFNIFESDIAEGSIVILLESGSHPDGYTGYTKNTVDNNEILKSYVTIYDVDSLSASQLNTIMMHEFGHVLGLAHSTDPEDLMYPVIKTDYPYISECNVDALEALYNGNTRTTVVCEK